MKFVVACYGSRGDVEPCAAVARELLRRGHEVRMIVPPGLTAFVETAGLVAVAAGPNLQTFTDAAQQLWTRTELVRNSQMSHWKKTKELNSVVRDTRELNSWCWRETTTTLTALVEGADLLLSGPYLEEPCANIAEYYGIPFASLHTFPMRANGQVGARLPSALTRFLLTINEWQVHWQTKKKAEDAQRRELRLPKAIGPSSRRMAKRGSLEIQAYDEVCFPGLAAEWEKSDGRRPFVGALMMELATEADADAASWIAAGTPPICFAFGSMPMQSRAATVEMISTACAELGERALICAGSTDFTDVALFDHVKVVGSVNYAAIFPTCRAVVHHGGSGTTAASLRSGVPTLILWTWSEQPLWGVQVERLQVGATRRLSSTTHESLTGDLGRILTSAYVTRARELASRMTKPAESVGRAADLAEDLARSKSIV